MIFYTYKITNQVTGRYYIGQRMCRCLPKEDTKYWGSSKYLAAERKIDPENWIKEIINVFDNKAEVLADERRLVTPEDPLCINRAKGGWHSYKDVMRSPEVLKEMAAKVSATKSGRPLSDEHRKALAEAQKGYKQSPEHIANRINTIKERMNEDRAFKLGNGWRGKKRGPQSEEHKLKLGHNHLRFKETTILRNKARKGKPQSEETKAKMRAAWARRKLLKEFSLMGGI